MFIQNSYQEMSFVQIASFWYENFVVFVGRWLHGSMLNAEVTVVQKATRSATYDGHRWTVTWCMNTAILN